MRENSTLRLCYATTSQAGSMRGSRRKTVKSVLRVAEGRVGEPDEGRPAFLYPWMVDRVRIEARHARRKWYNIHFKHERRNAHVEAERR